MFIVIGARDFSPEITVHLIGTKVPCFDKVPPPTNSHLSSSVLKHWDTCVAYPHTYPYDFTRRMKRMSARNRPYSTTPGINKTTVSKSTQMESHAQK